ncbi:class I SAM-dependent methyltransferase [Candidatus Rariloculus sp.]|uniref:class I SAM-dependent methyltransferase n=1 Tax=Candidatus Rariloculus sp. TaxID=3101265 RepID=UPI003D0BDFC5
MKGRWSPAQWTRYWQSGTVTTFHGRFANNYDGVVRSQWHGIFDRLPAGAEIVDLGTGNGAIAILAARYSHRRHRDFEITAVDFADIDPARQLSGKAAARHLPRIRFLGSTRIERTTLPDSTLDLAMSQFGFEYAPADEAVAEVDRILKRAGGLFAAMVHHADSAIVRQAKDGIAQVAICEQSGLKGLIRDLHQRLDRLKKLGRDATKDNRAIALRTEINERLAQLNRASDRSNDPGLMTLFVRQLMSTFDPSVAGGLSVDRKLKMLQDAAAETEAYRQRMQDLVSCALDDAQIDALVSKLADAGFSIEQSQPFVFEGAHFCQALLASR